MADRRKQRKLRQGRGKNPDTENSDRKEAKKPASRGLRHTRGDLEAKRLAVGHGGKKAGYQQIPTSDPTSAAGSQASSSPLPRKGLRRKPPRPLHEDDEEKQELSCLDGTNGNGLRSADDYNFDESARPSSAEMGVLGVAGEQQIGDVIATENGVEDSWRDENNSLNDENESQALAPNEYGLVSDQGLVKATAIRDSQVNPKLPQAEEVNLHGSDAGSSKRRKQDRRYFLLGALFLVVVCLAVAIPVVIVVTSGDQNTIHSNNHTSFIDVSQAGEQMRNSTSLPSSYPSMAPSSFYFAIQDLPDATVKDIAITGSPQQKAYEWTFAHPDFENMTNWRKKQLLALATFYYSLSGEAWDDQKNWMDPNSDECFWFTDRDAPAHCGDSPCSVPSSFIYAESLCFAKMAISEPFPPDPFVSNCDDRKKFQFLKWAPEIGVLEGTLPPELFFLTALTTLDLGKDRDYRGNNIHGTLPTEVGLLTLLQILDLSENKLEGTIPTEIGLTNLTDREGLNNGALALNRNLLSGSIPTQLGQLTDIKQINLQENRLTGAMPSEIGNLRELKWLEAQMNILSSAMPAQIGQLSELRYIILANNLLSAAVPSEIGLEQYWFDPNPWFDQNLEGIPLIDLSDNLLTGTIPGPLFLGNQVHLQNNQFSAISTNIGVLPSPTRLILDLGNNFISSVPGELFLLTSLQRLRLTGNMLKHLPPEVIQMDDNTNTWDCHLELDISENQLVSLPVEFGSVAYLQHWVLGHNHIAELPDFDFEDLGHVSSISLPKNYFSTLPMELFHLQNLEHFDISSNQISDQIPSHALLCGDANQSCAGSLVTLNLCNNSLSGSIPTDLGNFSDLEMLNLSSNLLGGKIPSSLFGEATHLNILDLSNNQLTGEIPTQVGLNFNSSENTTTLYSLVLGNNSLTAFIPSEVGLLQNLEVMDFSFNSLQGKIPPELSQIYVPHSLWDDQLHSTIYLGWTFLRTLNLGHNALTGSIPTQLGTLTNLQILDISFNNLTGAVPSELGLINASIFDGWKARDGNIWPVDTQILLQGNSFTGTLPLELCPWHCNSRACSSLTNCNTTVLLVDCLPNGSLDCYECTC